MDTELLNTLIQDLEALSKPLDLTVVSQRIQDFKTALDAAYAYPFQHYASSRAAIKSHFGDGPFLFYAEKHIRMTAKQMRSAQAKAAARVMERNSRQTVLMYQFVVTRVDWLKSNGLFVDKVLLLMLASGSRRCEIMGTGRSFFVKKGPHLIQQLGLAKKSDLSEVDNVLKPLLFFTADEFLALLSEIRSETASVPLDSNGLLSIFDRRLESLSKLCWPQYTGNGYPIGTHVCRSIYVSIAYQQHGDPRESISAFAVRVLGHEGFAQVPNYLSTHVTFEQSGPRFTEALNQYTESRDKLVPVVLVDDDEITHAILPVPHRRLSMEERDQLQRNRIADLEKRNIPPTKANLRLLNLL